MNTRRSLALIVPAALGLALLAAPAPRAHAGQLPVVREIVVRGFPGDASVITDLMQTKAGRPLDGAALNDDLLRLDQAGYAATFRQEILADGIRLVVEIVESLRVGQLRVRGAGRSWNRKLLDELVTRTHVAPAMLARPEAERFRGDKARIRAFCRQRGYRAVTVVSETARQPGTNVVDITFRVRCGPKHQVKWLRFEGNRGIPTRDLRARMQTKRDVWYTSRRYDDGFFEDDIVGLQDYYRFSGYPNARVTYRRTFRGRRGNKVDIAIFIDEGQQYPTTQVEIVGNQAVSTETLLAGLPLEIGAPYADAALVASRGKILRAYQETGYPEARCRADRRLTPQGDGYLVRFEIDEGERITINMVRTSGHPRTRRDVILRELELEPGMVYDVRKLDRSQRGLERLQYFDEITLKLTPAEPPAPGERDLLVDVTETETGYFRFGLGFSSAMAFIGAIELTQRNFDYRDSPRDWSDLVSGNAYVGAGQFFRVALYPGTRYSTYLVQYENPYWAGLNQSAGWSVYYRTYDYDTWLQRRIGVRVTRGIRKYKGDPDTDVVFHARVEVVSIFDVDEDDAPDDADDDEGTHPLLGVGVTVRRDRTDRRTLPTTGYKWEGGPELVVPYGLKFGVGGTRYWQVGQRPRGHERVFSLRGQADYAAGSFPIFERYYAGAPLIRGFEYRGAGPHDNDEPEGGKYRLVASAQYRYPLIADRLYSVLFVDTGTVTKDFSVFGDPRLAVGLGFRLIVPQISRAPLSLDIGVPVLKVSDDDTEMLYFSVSFDR